MFQRISLIGRVGQDPQMRYTPEGTPVTNFSIATTKIVSKDKSPNCPNGWKESYNGRNWELTTWWRIACWRRVAEVVNEYVTKGREVYIEGEIGGEATNGTLNPRVWEGQDGQPRASFELTASMVKLLGGRGGESGGGPPIGEPPPASGDDYEDSLPF